MSDDRSPGDARKPYSDVGGTDVRHAQTHDVERERQTNPSGPRPADESFAEDIGEQTPQRVHQQHLDADAGNTDKHVGELLPDLTDDELGSLPVLDPGTPLEQGSVYLNLNELQRGPFKAIGGHEVGSNDRIIAKKYTDHEIWNRVAGRDDEARIERPETT